MNDRKSPQGGPLDLYARLGLKGPEDRAGILRVLDDAGAEPVARRTAAFILCDEVRRTEHDAWWRTISTVAMLRTQLGLNESVLWSRSSPGDFARLAPTPERIRQAFNGASPPEGPGARKAGS